MHQTDSKQSPKAVASARAASAEGHTLLWSAAEESPCWAGEVLTVSHQETLLGCRRDLAWGRESVIGYLEVQLFYFSVIKVLRLAFGLRSS